MTKSNANYLQITSLLLVIISVAVIGVHELTGSHAQSFTTETARPANDFLNSEGVNVHMAAGPALADPNMAAAKVLQLGVRWVRSNTIANSAIKGDIILGKAGIKLDKPEDYDQYRLLGSALGAKIHDTVKNNLLPYTFAVEGINEPDTPSFNKGANGYADSCAAQPQLYNAIKSDPATKNLIVMEPSFTGLSLNTRGPQLLATCNLGAVGDFANMHPYPGGWPPEYGNIIETRKAGAEKYEGTGASKGVAFTETGYENATTGSNHPISKAGSGVYMPRIYLQYFAAGIGLTSPYDLVDKGTDMTNQEEHFGLYNLDWSPKPAATAVSNMNTILADTVSKPAGSLQYAIDDTTVKHLLLQKSDGSFYMALWREGVDGMVWDATNSTIGTKDMTLPGKTADVNVSFPKSMDVTTYMPNTSSSPIAGGSLVTTASKTVSVGPKVVILKLSAADITTPPPATNKPDLIVTSVSPLVASSGIPVKFSATIKNQGTAATPAGTVIGVSFKIDGAQVSYSDTDTTSLAPGASVTLTANNGSNNTANWTATTGSHTILARVDDIDRIAELDETNNDLSKPITVSVGAVVGDINNDGHVNTLDLSAVLTHDSQNYAPADLNHDGTVGAADLAILLSHWAW
jgi:hypothetical protein